MFAIVEVTSSGTIVYDVDVTVDITINPIFVPTENTSLVNGQIKGTKFVAEIPIFSNHSFAVQKLVNFSLSDPSEISDYNLSLVNFKGDFEIFENFNLDIISDSGRFNLLNIQNGRTNYFQFEKPLASTVDLMYEAKNFTETGSEISFSFSVYKNESFVKEMNLVLRTVEQS